MIPRVPLQSHGKVGAPTALVFTHIRVIYRSLIMASLRTLVSASGRGSLPSLLTLILEVSGCGRAAPERPGPDVDETVFFVRPDRPTTRNTPMTSKKRRSKKRSLGSRAACFTSTSVVHSPPEITLPPSRRRRLDAESITVHGQVVG
jgi:hypothetical protein